MFHDNFDEDYTLHTEPPQCMPEYCKVEGNTIQAYKNYYINEKQYFAKWTKRTEPEWYTEGTGTYSSYAS